ncbi:tyrosine--tRNA ligase, partial [Candidatus Beckwithbacteria bacterium CG23_combo_of_CG06-09_8_20_14_all_34_8]
MNSIITDPTIIDDFLTRRINKVIPNKDELRKRLLSGKRLRLYQGFDPSSANLHIGHLVGLLALKTFQDLGHEVIFLIG